MDAEDRSKVVAGRYEIVDTIGSGGMGQVVRVRHRRLGKAFAAEELFHREARLASQLSHPNIVEMIDFGNDPDWGWFIATSWRR